MNNIPVEIILHIFAFLPVTDLISLSQVNKRISELAGDQKLLRHLDFRKAYTCTQEELKTFLRPSKRCQLVYKLDMNAVYWFRPPFDTIARMKNLYSLHLRGIPLTFRQLHGLLTAGLPLQELTVDWPECPLQAIGMIEELQEGLSQLKFLCLTVQRVTNMVDLFLKQCQAPLRLVLFCEKMSNYYPYRSRCDIIFTHKPISVLPMEKIDWKMIGIDHFKKQDEDSASIIPSSLSQVTEVVSTSVDIIATLHSCPNLKGLQILLDPGQLLDLPGICEAAPRLERLRIDIGDSDGEKKRDFHHISSLHHLTHLSLPTDILYETHGTGRTSVASTAPRNVFSQRFKRPRLGAISNEEDAEVGSLNLIIDNCPLLTMLEIGVGGSMKCVRSRLNISLPIYWQSLKNIKKLKRLTHLALCSIPVTNGHFLYEIAVGCPRLEFLSLSDLGPSGKCCYLKDLSDSVTRMSCLTHLRVDQQYLAPGTALFTALKECRKLQRLSIYSARDMLPMDLSALEQLVKASPSLIFIAVEGAGTSKTACSKFTRNLKKISRPALVVLTSMEKHSSQLPYAHTDMVCLMSWLSGSHTCFYNLDIPFRHYVLQISGS